jgi:hypothetical protein
MEMHTVLIILAIIIVGSCLYTYTNTPLEGFKTGEAPDDRKKKVEAEVKVIKDELNIADYHGSYDDMMVQLEKWAQMKRLKLLVSTEMTDPKEMMSTVSKVNELSLFMQHLDDATKFLIEKT